MSSLPSRPSRSGFHKVRRDVVLLVSGLVALCVLCAWGGGALPKTITFPPPKPSAVAAAAEPSPTATAPGQPGATVAHPWRPGQTQLGVNVFWTANASERPAVTQAKIDATVRDVVGLGANWMAVSFPFVTGGITSDRLSADPSLTPSVSDLRTLMTEAQKAGLRVTLRPLMDERDLVAENPLAWRGTIDPASRSRWFANYESFLTPYLQMAQSAHVDEFNISTELSSMEDDTAGWNAFVGHVRKIYTGKLVDSINYNRIDSSTPRIPKASVGVDAYFPLKSASDRATVSELAAGWNKWLDSYSTGDLTDLTLSEVGIVPQDGAYQAPFVWAASGVYNAQIQSNWDKAACQVAQQRHVAGIFWWYVNLDIVPLPGSPRGTSDPMDVLGAPATSVIRSCFADYPSGK